MAELLDPAAYKATIITPIRGNYGECDRIIAAPGVRAMFAALKVASRVIRC